MSAIVRHRLAGMEESPTGGWVSYSDHAKAINALDRTITDQAAQIERLNAALVKASQQSMGPPTVADARLNNSASSVKSFCERYGLSLHTVQRKIAEGEIPARKTGRRVLITSEDERAWLDNLPHIRKMP